jgi:CRISPR/Cas system-associated endoribonuclease Cas2
MGYYQKSVYKCQIKKHKQIIIMLLWSGTVKKCATEELYSFMIMTFKQRMKSVLQELIY